MESLYFHYMSAKSVLYPQSIMFRLTVRRRCSTRKPQERDGRNLAAVRLGPITIDLLRT